MLIIESRHNQWDDSKYVQFLLVKVDSLRIRSHNTVGCKNHFHATEHCAGLEGRLFASFYPKIGFGDKASEPVAQL